VVHTDLLPECRELPQLDGLTSLVELGVQGNPGLRVLPGSLGALPALRHLSAADCALEAVPASLGAALSLESLTLYGNALRDFPPAVLQVGGASLRARVNSF
jgi:Leucine-rich repeat (LRR) protein